MAEQAGDSVDQDTPGQTDEGQSGDGGTADRSFSAADVERIVKDRLARAKTTPPPDYDDLKAKAARLAELEAANQTELEKAQARAEQAEREREQVLADAREIRLRAAILGEAAKADRKIIDPDAVIALLDRSTLELDPDGVPTNIATAMDQLLEQRPYLVAAGGSRGDADQGARGGNGPKQLTAEDATRMTPEEVQKAVREGRFATALGAKP